MENRTAKCCRLPKRLLSVSEREADLGAAFPAGCWRGPLSPGARGRPFSPCPRRSGSASGAAPRWVLRCWAGERGPAPQASAPSLTHISEPLPTRRSWSLDLRVAGLLRAILGSSDFPFGGGSGSPRASGWRNGPAQTSAVGARGSRCVCVPVVTTVVFACLERTWCSGIINPMKHFH